jgi:hypothetical protein
MPKATAVWLVDNTTLTFDQIAAFCALHALEVQAIADGEVAPGMHGLDPLANGQLTKEEIARCEADGSAELEMAKPNVPLPKVRQKGARYTPISKRQDRPDAIAWLLRNYPELSDAQISRMIGTTKPTINAVRDKTHHNTTNIKPQSPVYLGLCTPDDLEKMVAIARARAGTTRAPAPEPEAEAAPEAAPEPAIRASGPLKPQEVFGETVRAPEPEAEPEVSADTLFKERPAEESPAEDAAAEIPAEESPAEENVGQESPAEESAAEESSQS